MPVQLSKPTRCQLHDGRRQGFGNGKIPRVDNGKGAAATGRGRGLLLRQVIDVRAIAFQFSVRRDNRWIADVSLVNVGVGTRHGVEDGYIDAKVLGEHRLWSVGDPVVDVKGSPGHGC